MLNITDPYLLAALGLWAAWGISWLVSALWVGRSEREAGRRAFGWQFAIACLGFFCLFVEAPVHLHGLWRNGGAIGAAMVALVAAGLAFGWWARLHLGRLWSVGVTRREGHRIVQSGPYSLVRHPIYTALIAAGLGLAVLKATPLALFGVLCLAVGFGMKARVEERFLGRELGQENYEAYRARVPMLVPFLRRKRQAALRRH